MYQVLGFEFRSYMNKNNVRVEGYNVHCVVVDSEKEGLVGQEVDTLWVSRDMFIGSRPEVGNYLDVRYNKYGKVKGIEVITS